VSTGVVAALQEPFVTSELQLLDIDIEGQATSRGRFEIGPDSQLPTFQSVLRTNGDSTDDFLVYSRLVGTPGSFLLLESAFTDSTWTPNVIPVLENVESFEEPYFGDFDGDGSADGYVAVNNPGNTQLTVIRDLGGTPTPVTFTTLPNTELLDYVGVADFNADGVEDAVRLTRNTVGLMPTVYAMVVEWGPFVSGDFSARTTLPLPPSVDGQVVTDGLLTHDLDGDGFPDILFAYAVQSQSYYAFYRSLGVDSDFDSPLEIELPENSRLPVIADFARSGLPAIIGTDVSEPFARALRVFGVEESALISPRTDLGFATGALTGTGAPSTDRFGDTVWPALTSRVVRVMPHTGERSFEQARLVASQDFVPGERPLSSTLHIVGTTVGRIASTTDVSCPNRIELVSRFGRLVDPGSPDASRRGLNLDTEDGGYVIELSWLAGVDPGTSIRVVGRLDGWQRAAEATGDGLFGTDEGQTVLPAGADCAPRYRFQPTWTEASEVADLSQGEGIRFVVDANARTIRILTDGLGVFRAYTSD
ncbi:MAG: VCBS repeat-containing protein, partial [Myxococcota bacterium]